ncbi:hypothetical protein SLG_26600 [Sphingobium sp. SYK-6]|uniref:hypothetical protein n=1 Tax=Sphingobium sp. (strain NBRC 103272 / SYK-6) TaxID=627192 RepID=UPI0002276F24|nr:hypothetical protein [Sphingobium sp. SYK-6]BAK67335.1 hypothetical protein SLG_26600 [Sphingobium sp. SYK-6]
MGVVQHLLAPQMRELKTSLADMAVRFYPDVTVSIDEQLVTLSSDARSDDALRRILQVMIVNEWSVRRSESARLAVIERLLQ